MAKLFELVLDNADRITSYVILLCIVIVLGSVLYGFVSGKLASPGDYKRLDTECKEATTALKKVTDELSEARQLHAGALVRIEYLEKDNQRLERDLAGINLRCGKLEAEVEILRRERDRWHSSEPV